MVQLSLSNYKLLLLLLYHKSQLLKVLIHSKAKGHDSKKSKSHYNWWSVSQYVKVSSPLWDLWPDMTFCPKVTLRLTVSMSRHQAHLGTCDQILILSECCCLKFAILFLWGALSDERTGLQFALYSLDGLSHAEPVTILYCHLRLPQPGEPGSHISIP
jgi:hypothetical protein